MNEDLEIEHNPNDAMLDNGHPNAELDSPLLLNIAYDMTSDQSCHLRNDFKLSLTSQLRSPLATPLAFIKWSVEKYSGPKSLIQNIPTSSGSKLELTVFENCPKSRIQDCK